MRYHIPPDKYWERFKWKCIYAAVLILLFTISKMTQCQ